MTSQDVAAPDLVPYPAELAAHYRAVGAWRDRTIAEELRATADRFPDRPALVGPDGEFCYAELDEQTDRIAVGLRKLGVASGDRVLLQLTNSATTALAWYGVLKAGAVPVATLALHRRHEIVAVAEQCDPVAHIIEPSFRGHDLRVVAGEARLKQPSLRVLVTVGATIQEPGETSIESLIEADVDPAEARAAVEAVQAELSPEGIGVLQLSGGTTSVPKLIPLTHTQYWFNARAWASAMEMGEDTCAAHLLPLVHNAGIVCALHPAHAVGGCVATTPMDADRFKAIAGTRPVTHMLMTRPIMRLIEADAELRRLLRSLRVVVWADRALPASAIETFETSSCRVASMFGMGEGLCMFTPRGVPPEIAHGTNGTPVTPYEEVRVLDPGLESQVPPGTRGELCVRGPYTIRGYFRAPERNAQAFTSDGFYRTGDIVVEVPYGGRSYYRLEDRIKDLINRGGEKINAEEVELVLLSHPAVERAAVVAMPDERLGERSCAFLVARDGMSAPDLDEVKKHFDAQGVAKFKWPERVEHRTELPLTNIHKINKATLRQEIAGIVATEQAVST